jgi:hypothetical protein
LEAARERFSQYQMAREEQVRLKVERTREHSRLNVEQARALRERYDRQGQP